MALETTGSVEDGGGFAGIYPGERDARLQRIQNDSVNGNSRTLRSKRCSLSFCEATPERGSCLHFSVKTKLPPYGRSPRNTFLLSLEGNPSCVFFVCFVVYEFVCLFFVCVWFGFSSAGY